MAVRKSSTRKAASVVKKETTVRKTSKRKLESENVAVSLETQPKRVRKIRTLKPKRLRSGMNPFPALPEEKIKIFAVGSGGCSELGLGPDVTEALRPKLNRYLLPWVVGVVDFFAGDQHGLALDKDGKIWSWGSNDDFSLGREIVSDPDIDTELDPQESCPKKIDTFPEDVKFVQVASSELFSAAITSDYHVYGWGTFRAHSLTSKHPGFELPRDKILTKPPKLLPHLERVVQLAGGGDSMMALTADGRVYTWGFNYSGQLGHPTTVDEEYNYLEPSEKKILKNIVRIGAGAYHAFAIDKDGRVLSWGSNSYGQCGHPIKLQEKEDEEEDDENGNTKQTVEEIEEANNLNNIWEPTYIEFFDDKDIIDITGGGKHSIALSRDGSVYTFGLNDDYQLGVDHDQLENKIESDSGKSVMTYTPVKVTGEDLPKFIKIASGGTFCVAVGEDNSVWVWGSNISGQCGTGDDEGCVEEPTKVNFKDNKIVHVSCGTSFTLFGALPKEGDEERFEPLVAP